MTDDGQFGSRKGRSTSHAVIALLHSWMAGLDSGVSVRTVFVDFRKAFELVNHNVLCNKLKKYGIPTFYCAMHFSAKRGIEIACRPSVRLFVCPKRWWIRTT